MATSKLNIETFKEKIFDFTQGGDWKFEGDKPAIIDFYADWCGPCKMMWPIISKFESENGGKWMLIKVDAYINGALKV